MSKKPNEEYKTDEVSVSVVTRCSHPYGGDVIVERLHNHTTRRVRYVVCDKDGFAYNHATKRAALRRFAKLIQLTLFND